MWTGKTNNINSLMTFPNKQTFLLIVNNEIIPVPPHTAQTVEFTFLKQHNINFDLIILTFEIKANTISKIIKASNESSKYEHTNKQKIHRCILTDRLINNSVPMIQQYKPYGVL